MGYPPVGQAPPLRGDFAESRGSRGVNVGMAGSPASQYIVKMRGLPYTTTEKDLKNFFHPLVILKMDVSFDKSGRPSGEAEIYFHSHDDAIVAMQKHKHHIGK